MLVVSGSFLGMTFQDISHLIILLILMISVEAGDVKPVGLCPFILISSSNQMMFFGVTFPEAPTGDLVNRIDRKQLRRGNFKDSWSSKILHAL